MPENNKNMKTSGEDKQNLRQMEHSKMVVKNLSELRKISNEILYEHSVSK